MSNSQRTRRHALAILVAKASNGSLVATQLGIAPEELVDMLSGKADVPDGVFQAAAEMLRTQRQEVAQSVPMRPVRGAASFPPPL
jgi:hypothetical protein